MLINVLVQNSNIIVIAEESGVTYEYFIMRALPEIIGLLWEVVEQDKMIVSESSASLIMSDIVGTVLSQ